MLCPEIYETRFGDQEKPELTKSYAKINSRIMRKAVEVLHETLLGGYWCVRIEDWYDNEENPHYLLKFGYAAEAMDDESSDEVYITFIYCDNYSCAPDTIKQVEGTIKVWVACEVLVIKKDYDLQNLEKKADEIAGEYIRSLNECLSSHYIVAWKEDKQILLKSPAP
ncbi:MAG: hypothetical protein LBC95_02495 [Candidatus Nomurabacteria bacterium]|jgi:hypothetical protein|nr:hypothetical protein [Candidatus Nomurabacteria bacterium]